MTNPTNPLGESPRIVAVKLKRWSGGVDSARAVAFKQLLYYRRLGNTEMVDFYGSVLDALAP